jgi:hypothetical protein
MKQIIIEIEGHVDKKWAEWFEEMEIIYHKDITVLTGSLPDQSALHGLLNKIRDLNLTLISVNTERMK